ncbi:unnamed protein product [Brachionus calyciflorus]|uniref:Uncharacterized protein n=1 Tax=Brachionus calyciflorus TaxID=104777 RepID=A0A813PAY1_9BILA|nr:unnamed protein product [Brachionus calyciflorus]
MKQVLEEKTEIKYIPTKKINLNQVNLPGKSPEIKNLKIENFPGRLIKSKSNANVGCIMNDDDYYEKGQTIPKNNINNNSIPNQSSETKSNCRRIYENEFSIKSRAKSADTNCLINRDKLAQTNNEKNINSKNKNIPTTTTTSSNSKSNYLLDNNSVAFDKEMHRMAYHIGYNRYKERDLIDLNGFYSKMNKSYQMHPSVVSNHRRYRAHAHRQMDQFDWAYEMERERLENMEAIRSRRSRRYNQSEELVQNSEFISKLDYRNARSQSNDSQLNEDKYTPSSSVENSSPELVHKNAHLRKPEQSVVETAVQTSTESLAEKQAESKLVSELKSQMEVLKAEIARLQNAQTTLEKNLKQQQQQQAQQQQQNTILRPIIYSGANLDQGDYTEYTLDQFIQSEDQLFNQQFANYADLFNAQNQATMNSIMNQNKFINSVQSKPQQINQTVINKNNNNQNETKSPVKASTLTNLTQNSSGQNVNKNIPNNPVFNNKPVQNQQKINVNPMQKVMPSQNIDKKPSVPITTQLNVNTTTSEPQIGPISPNAQLYQKLLKLVSDSVDLTDSEISKQMSTLLSNPHIKTRLKQLHSQLLQDPNQYWPKLESILLFDNPGKDSFKLQNLPSLQKKLQNVIHDLVDLKKYYSESSASINNNNTILNNKQFSNTPHRVINREFKNLN